MSERRFMRMKEALRTTALSKSSLYALRKAGRFPEGFMLSPRCRCFWAHDVLAWCEASAGDQKRREPAGLAQALGKNHNNNAEGIVTRSQPPTVAA